MTELADLLCRRHEDANKDFASLIDQEAERLKASADGWRQARVVEVLDLMARHNISIADIQNADILSPMVNIAGTQTPHLPSGNTVAGQ
jgi:hypothetical protein